MLEIFKEYRAYVRQCQEQGTEPQQFTEWRQDRPLLPPDEPETGEVQPV